MRSLLAALALLLAAGPALAGAPVRSQWVRTMTFQNGVAPLASYSGIEATFINSSAADSGKNFGAADTLHLSGAAWTGWRSGQNKLLIKCDISALPDSSSIVEAKAYLYQRANNTGANTDTVVAYRLFPPVTFGTGNGTASVSSATWTTRHQNDSPADVYTGGGWGAAGASAVGTTSAVKWWGTAGDSAVGASFTGGDTVDVKNAGVAAVDRSAEGVLGFTKTGAGAGTRSGWWTIDMTHQFDLWHTGANTNNGFIVEMHSNANNKSFPILGDNFPDKPYRIKVVIKYIDPEEIEASGGGSVVPGAGLTSRKPLGVN
jgi:hypothetical protein